MQEGQHKNTSDTTNTTEVVQEVESIEQLQPMETPAEQAVGQPAQQPQPAKKKKPKKHKHRRYRIMPYLTIILIMTSFLMALNFPAYSYKINKSSYDIVDASIDEVGVDGLFAIVPKITVTYEYNEEEYTESYLNYNFWMYGGIRFLGSVKEKEGEQTHIAVNKDSPSNILDWSTSDTIFESWINIILILINIVCLIMIFNNVRRYIPQRIKEKFIKRARKEAKKQIKSQKKRDKNGKDKTKK